MSTAEQWETATVRVEDIEGGWKIGLGGMLVEIYGLDRGVTISAVDLGPMGRLKLANNTAVEVRRPVPTDPDADLVGIMAEAIFHDEYPSFSFDAHFVSHRRYVDNAVAALTAARAAGYRIERAS